MPTKLEPTLHKPIPMNTRVRLDTSIYPGNILGTVIGISFQHVIFGYIVLLDEPITYMDDTFGAISVPGPQLWPIDPCVPDWHISG